MKLTIKILVIGISLMMFNACGSDDGSIPKPPSSSNNKILPLGASRVEGLRPEYESFRYELWKDLIDGDWTFDFIGTRSDNASYPSYKGNNFDVDHEGGGGGTSGQILSGIEGWLNETGSPDIVLFSSPGGNDALEGLPYEDTVENINNIIDIIQADNPSVTIFIEQMAPGRSDFMTAELTSYINQLQQEVLNIASNQSTSTSQVIAVDMFTGFNDSLLADDIHYNEAGAEFIATRYYNVLEQNVFLPLLAFAQTAPGGLVRSNDIVDEREDGSGAFRTHCLESHDSYNDPLVYPGREGAAHHHVFFGNPTVDAQTTIADLSDANRTTCDGKTLNRSAYWVPALYDGRGARIKYVEPLFYYKTGYHVPAKLIEPPPEGLRMIAGNAHATAPQGTQVVKFRCASWSDAGQWFDPGDPLDHVDYLPDCALDDLLEVRVVFPQCWDGRALSAPDNQSHMAYPREAEPPVVGTGVCPASHPVAIPEISYNFAIYVTAETGPPSTWRVSSDRPDVTTPGVSMHADWMNGWDPKIMKTIVENCLRPARECGVGQLGDGTRLWPVVRD